MSYATLPPMRAALHRRHAAVHGFLDDLFGDEEAGEGVGPDGPTRDASTPVGRGTSYWQCPSGNYPVTDENATNGPEPGCIPLSQTRKADGTWGQTAGATAATGDNPVSRFFSDLFGGNTAENANVPPPATSAPAASGSTVVVTPSGPVVVQTAPSGPTPTQMAVGALVVLGLGYAAYRYL